MSVVATVSCKKTLSDLWKCKLLKQDQVQLANEFVRRNPRASPRDLTDYLVGQNALTPSQADEYLAISEQRVTLWVYTLLEPLGRGSMGIVYKATSRNDNKLYALKVLPRRNVGSVSRVPQRLRAFLDFQHPTVLPLVYVGTAGERHYLVWPYVEGGETLEARVERLGRLPAKEVVHYGLQIARAMQACHDHGLFHGLLKPSNFLIAANHQLYILDLGIGFLLTAARGESILNTLVSTNQLASSLNCASPESVLDTTNRTPWGDQYSLGCVLYFCLTGKYPFPIDNPVKKMMAHQFEEPVPLREHNSEVPPRLAEIVSRLMQKAPANRFGSMREAEEALQSLLARPDGSRPRLAAETQRAPAGSHPKLEAAKPDKPEPERKPTPVVPAAVPAQPGRMASLFDVSGVPEAAKAPPPRKAGGVPILAWLGGMLGAALLGGLVVWFLSHH
jgi:serine/threonine protein kinase